MPAFVNLEGHRFGRLTVSRRADNRGARTFWQCQCDCGRVKDIWAGNLRLGKTHSCGCLGREASSARLAKRSTRHGLSGSRVHRIWLAMRSRCQQPSSGAFRKYGARGVAVCARWQTFENFLADMGEPPTERHTIDRIDGGKGYEPNNCRWATYREQNDNRSTSRRITVGCKTLTLREWGAELGIPQSTIQTRLRLGWAPDIALTKAVRAKRQSGRVVAHD